MLESDPYTSAGEVRQDTSKLQPDHQWRCSTGLDDQLERLSDPPFDPRFGKDSAACSFREGDPAKLDTNPFNVT